MNTGTSNSGSNRRPGTLHPAERFTAEWNIRAETDYRCLPKIGERVLQQAHDVRIGRSIDSIAYR